MNHVCVVDEQIVPYCCVLCQHRMMMREEGWLDSISGEIHRFPDSSSVPMHCGLEMRRGAV